MLAETKAFLVFSLGKKIHAHDYLFYVVEEDRRKFLCGQFPSVIIGHTNRV